jgi:hypothetical protein
MHVNVPSNLFFHLFFPLNHDHHHLPLCLYNHYMTILYLYFLPTAAIYTVTFFLSLGYWLFSTHSKQTSSSSSSLSSSGVVDSGSNSVPEESYIQGACRFHTIMIIYHTSYLTYHTCYVLQCMNDRMNDCLENLYYRLNAAVLLTI